MPTIHCLHSQTLQRTWSLGLVTHRWHHCLWRRSFEAQSNRSGSNITFDELAHQDKWNKICARASSNNHFFWSNMGTQPHTPTARNHQTHDTPDWPCTNTAIAGLLLYYLEFAGRNHLLTTFNLRNYQEMAKHPYWKECMLTHIAIDEIRLRPPRHPQRICIFSLPFSEFMPVLSMRKDPFAIPSNGPFAVSTAQHKQRSDSHI